MIGTLLILLLALVLLAYIAVPLLLPGQSDPLPDWRDPVLLELEEEKAALFRAIRELDAREDLPEARRAELRARYEAKAAKVLHAAETRAAELAGRQPAPRTRTPRRTPWAALALLGLLGGAAVVMSGYVLPRVGQDATITTGDLTAARELKALQQAAQRDPSTDNLLALADAYWRLGDAEGAKATYLRLSQQDAAPALVYQRLGFLALQEDLSEAQRYLEQARDADPTNPDTLYTLAELYFAQAQPERAIETMRAYLALPEGAADAQAQARLATMEQLGPLLRRATDDPNEENLLALAEAYWNSGERERAADLYLRVLSNLDPHNGVALARLGQVLFTSGRAEEAAQLLARARELGDADPTTLLFLGNAYFSLERYPEAIDAWQAYVAAVGGEAQAGRVPSLIASAEARLAGATGESTASPSGAQLYAANCATCHGAAGEGGSGPTLAGSARARDEANVRDAIRFGRGMMPGFGARLSDAEITAITRYVVESLGATTP